MLKFKIGLKTLISRIMSRTRRVFGKEFKTKVVFRSVKEKKKDQYKLLWGNIKN